MQKTDEGWKQNKYQRNKCVQLLRKAKLQYYKNLGIQSLADNRKFWKSVKLIFTDKIQVSQSINRAEMEKL